MSFVRLLPVGVRRALRRAARAVHDAVDAADDHERVAFTEERTFSAEDEVSNVSIFPDRRLRVEQVRVTGSARLVGVSNGLRLLWSASEPGALSAGWDDMMRGLRLQAGVPLTFRFQRGSGTAAVSVMGRGPDPW